MAYRDEGWLAKFDFMKRRKQAYQMTFKSLAGDKVLIDLARFCRANETCFHTDPGKHNVMEGRREVWLRIQTHLGLTAEQLMTLYDGRGVYQQETESTQ